MNLLYVLAGVGAVGVLLFIAAYSWSNDGVIVQETADEKIRVYASFFPYFDFAKNIAGDKAEVQQFVPPGLQAHGWEPGANKLQDLTGANIFIYNGLGIEPYVEKMMNSGKYENTMFVKATKGIDLLTADEDSHDHGHDDHDFDFDPHTWLDPILVKTQVNNIKDSLIQIDPENTDYYEQNANIYNIKLDKLDEQIKSSLSTCEKDSIATLHNAFTYFAQRYDLKVYSLSGFEHESEFSISEMIEFTEHLKEHDINFIFGEENIDSRISDVIAEETDTKVLIFSPIESLDMQDAERGVSYIEKMEQNLHVLEEALECQ